MLRSIRRQLWICPKCRLQQQRPQSSLATAAAAVTGKDTDSLSKPDRLPLLADHSTPGAQNDDNTLRKIFNYPSFWKRFSQRRLDQECGKPTGLFQNRYLTSKDGFQVFAEITLDRVKRKVSKILDISTVQGYKNIARDLDTISDLLCRVIDLCDFVRATHPDRDVQRSASAAYTTMFEYMNVLNTTTGLYDQLQQALGIPEVVQSWTEEEKLTAQILMKDFSKSAIDLPPEQRSRFVDLSCEINMLGSEFVEKLGPEKSHLVLPSGTLKGLDPEIARRISTWGRIILPTTGPATIAALRGAQDGDRRREIYVASRTVGTEQIDRLEQLLRRRAEIASLSGFKSFGHMTLGDKMAKSPESVDKFLQALHGKNKGRAEKEYLELFLLKRRYTYKEEPDTQLNAWDRDYYTLKHLMGQPNKLRHPDSLSAYFSLGNVMQGISRLFTRLYGLRLVPRQTMPGETWNDEVRRLDVMDENDGHIAVVYCDLFERPSKNPNPAHFTLRCSRHISREEIEELSLPDSDMTRVEALTDGMASTMTSSGELYQLPTIALICDFARPLAGSKGPPLLTFREMQTLFHEMGHALHSFLGRTSMQNVSGTRCATDLAELPSILMEHFVTDWEVLSLFARHWETNEPLPYQPLEVQLERHNHHEATEIETQIILSALDQAYHSPLAHSADFNTTRIYHDIVKRYAIVPEPAETNWQGLFGHLFGYGATYYAYLFDRAIALKIWRELFQRRRQRRRDGDVDATSPLSRKAGSRFREEMLKWGGSRDGWKCVAGVLGDESLAEGGEEAMRKVGEWGVHNDD